MATDRIAQWMKEIRLLDGGFGSECEKRSHLPIDGHKAWSCRLLKEDPNLVCDIHKSFLRAGCDVISTNTYQASVRTLSEALDISVCEAKELMRHAVRLAKRAVDAVNQEESTISPPRNRKLPVLIAGSLGSYGACMADGSEYSGVYGKHMSFTDLVDFHLARAELLISAGVDLLAWETIPLLSEVAAICEVMRRLPNAVGWISVISLDGQTTAAGDPLHEVASEVGKCDRLFGIGVNCAIPHHLIGQALANLSSIYDSCDPGNEDGYHPPPCEKRPGGHSDQSTGQRSRKLLLVYANSGEKWMPTRRKNSRVRGHWIWPPNTGPNTWAREMTRWAVRRTVPNPERLSESSSQVKSVESHVNDVRCTVRAQWVGGCCRVGPEQLIQLAHWMKPDETYQFSERESAGGIHTALEFASTSRRTRSNESGRIPRKAPKYSSGGGDQVKRRRSC